MNQWLTNNQQQINCPLPSVVDAWLLPPHTCLLDIPRLPVTAKLAHIVPDLEHSSLKYVKQFVEAGCRVEYDVTNFYLYFNNNTIIHGPRDEKTKVWIFFFELIQHPLSLNRTKVQDRNWPDNPNMTTLTWSQQHSKTQHSGLYFQYHTYFNATTFNAFYHQCLVSSTASTWIAAINN